MDTFIFLVSFTSKCTFNFITILRMHIILIIAILLLVRTLLIATFKSIFLTYLTIFWMLFILNIAIIVCRLLSLVIFKKILLEVF